MAAPKAPKTDSEIDIKGEVLYLLEKVAILEPVLAELLHTVAATNKRVAELERLLDPSRATTGIMIGGIDIVPATAPNGLPVDCAWTLGLRVRGIPGATVPNADGRPATCLMCNRSYGVVGARTTDELGAFKAQGCGHWGYGADCASGVRNSVFVSNNIACNRGNVLCYKCSQPSTAASAAAAPTK